MYLFNVVFVIVIVLHWNRLIFFSLNQNLGMGFLNGLGTEFLTNIPPQSHNTSHSLSIHNMSCLGQVFICVSL